MNKISEESLRFLVIIKNDAQSIFKRIKYREREYLQILCVKRTREHFKSIFNTHYDSVTMRELMLCSAEVIISLDKFYDRVEELKWYLMHSEDMPAMMEDKLEGHQREISLAYQNLILYINAEIGIEEKAVIQEEVSYDLPQFSSPEDFKIQESSFDGDTPNNNKE